MKLEASYHQQRLWFIDKFEKGNVYEHAPVYHNVPVLLHMNAPVDNALLKQVLNIVLNRHEVLRTVFIEEGNMPCQVVLPVADHEIAVVSFKGTLQERVQFAIQLAQQPFDFLNNLLARATVIETPGLQPLLLLTVHSALVDKHSVYLLVKELDAVYTSLLQGEEPSLPSPAIQYPAFAAWQKSFPANTVATLLAYWKRYLQGKLPPLELPLDSPRVPIHVYASAQEYFSLGKETAAAIYSFCQENGISVQSFLLSAYKILLKRYSGADEVVLGIVGKNRDNKELEKTIGPIANLLVIRSAIDEQDTLVAFARKLAKQVAQAYQFQALPFDKLVVELAPEKDMARTALFDVLFQYEEDGLQEAGGKLASMHFTDTNLGWGKYDLNLVVTRSGDDFQGILVYNADYFNASGMQRLVQHFKELVNDAVKSNGHAIDTLQFLPGEEKNKILTIFNDPLVGYPGEQTIVGLFEEQVNRFPDRIAVTCNATRLTYAELNSRANQLTATLLKRGAGPGSIVGLALGHTEDMIIGMIATLKIGAAYLPLDESYPAARITYMLEDSGCGLVVTNHGYANTAIDKNKALIIGKDYSSEVSALPTGVVTPDNLAYIIYTSGTTGLPKGTMITHRNVVRLFFNDKPLFDFNENDVWSLFHSFCFDFSVWEMYGALFFGGEVVLVPRLTAKDTPAFLDLITQHKITVLNQTPSAFYNLSGSVKEQQRELAVRYIIFGGEALNASRLKDWHTLYPATRLVNMYGITETTVHVTYKEITGEDIDKGLNNIGRPISTTTLYILDAKQQLAPIGVPGEIYVGGKGVGNGYIGKPELSATKFIPNPFQPGEYMYRSGDAGRWLSTGEVVYLGRIDQQVQLRGFRIETGEIESKLLRFPGIMEAVVIMRDDDGHQYLCAYYVANTEYDRMELRAWLEKDLPEYMLPSYFVKMAKIPLTSNGKVDRKELPLPVIVLTSRKDEATNELEQVLVNSFEQVLGVNNIGVNDNFFLLGGDSINTIQVVSRLQQQGYELRIQDIFRNPTARELSTCVTKKSIVIDQEQVSGAVGLLPAQNWFFDQPATGRHHFNQSISIELDGTRNEEMIDAVFGQLMQHHDALRMVFRTDEKGILQECLSQSSLTIEKVDLTTAGNKQQLIEVKANAAQASFDLANGPLVKLLLFVSDENSRLLIIIHHLVVDGVSWRILLEDVDTLIKQYRAGKTLSLPAKTASVKRWRQDLDNYKKTTAFKKAVTYWEAAANAMSIPFPKDHAVAGSCNADTESITFKLPESITRQLVTTANNAYGTNTQDILLAALVTALHTTFNIRQCAVMLEGHGREPLEDAANTNRTVGWFTSFYPVQFAAIHAGSISQLLRGVKESVRQVPNHGFDYGIWKYETASAGNVDHTAEILFNFLGQFDADTTTRSFTLGGYTGREADLQRQRMFALEVSGMVVNHQLQMRLSYSRKEYREETILKLASAYEAALEALIGHCSARTTRLKSPSDFTYKGLLMAEIDALQREQPIDDIYPMSPMQEGMLFHTLLDPGEATYTVQFSYQVEGDVDVVAMESAFGQLIARYDVLRTVMLYEGQELPLQMVLSDKKGGFFFEDVRSEVSEQGRAAVVQQYWKQDKARGFDLQKDILVRLSILQTEELGYQFIWNYHHIVMDGWCTGILIKEFTELYEAARSGMPAQLAGVTPFVRYIEWLENQDKEEAKQFWKNYLSDLEEPSILPRNAIVAGECLNGGFKEEQTVIAAEKVDRLNALANSAGVTLNTVVQAAWSILLSRYNNSNDVLFGAVVSGRTADIAGIETMVGLFINTIPVRVRLSGTVTDLLRQLQQQAMDSLKYEYYPLADIQAETGRGSALMNHLLAFENFPAVQGVDGKYKVTDVAVSEQPNYDLNVVILPGESMVIKFLYNVDAYSPAILEELKRNFACVLDNISADAGRLVSTVGMLTQDEQFKLAYGFNQTKKDFDSDEVIHRLFEQQAARTPDATALIYYDQVITYRELNEKANHLALQLLDGSETKGQAVAVLMNRSVELVITLFAILKAGGTYIPIEPYLPDGRIKRLLRSLGCEKLVMDASQEQRMGALAAELPELEKMYCFEAIGDHPLVQPIELKNEPVNPDIAVSATDTAYIIFTSGSSGTPKGVIIKHRPVINLIEWVNRTYNINDRDKVLFVSSVSFDLSVYDIFGILAGGGSVQIMANRDINDSEKLFQYIYKYGITYWDSAPAALQQLVPWIENASNEETKNCFRLVFLSGDWIPLSLPDNIRNTFKQAQVIALGGATEATVWSNFFPVGAIDPQWKSIPYGKPMQNAMYYVLDKDLMPCPVGTQGDLFIGGECIATGYVNEVKLTDNRFIDNPFHAGEKMYRTGDTARWFKDGNIEFLGRKDSQVKIRGHRIELGEIQYHLKKSENIKEGRVFVQMNNAGDRFLCAYYIAEGQADKQKIREYLQQELPAYMVPLHYVQIDQFPVTANGKLDMAALPNPSENEHGQALVLPRNITEHQLAEIWMDIFRMPAGKIGVHDNFFELGGHSIKAAMMTSKINKKLRINLPLRTIFSAPTIAELSLHCAASPRTRFADIKPAEKKQYYKVASNQKQFFLVQKMYPRSTAYNIPYIFELKENISSERLAAVFSTLVQRHESLRTSFHLLNQAVVQIVHEAKPVVIELTEIAGTDPLVFQERLAQGMRQFSRPFTLSASSLIRIGYFTGIKNILAVDIHHIISDRTSQEILVQDFLALLQEKELPKQSFQYKDIAEYRARPGYANEYRKMEEYWVQKLEGELPEINLSGKRSAGVKSFSGGKTNFVIEKEDTAWLRALATRENTGMNTLLLSIFSIVIARVTKQDEMLIGFSMSGRNRPELENIVGALVNTLVLRSFPLPERKFIDYLRLVKEDIVDAATYQEFTFDDLVDKLKVKREAGRNPLFEIIFDYSEPPVLTHLEKITEAGNFGARSSSKFDLYLQMEGGERIQGSFQYAADLLDKETVDEYAFLFREVIASIRKDENTVINAMPVPGSEHKEMLPVNEQHAASVPALLRKSYIDNKDRVAVYSKQQSYTYRQLQERAGHVKNYLLEKGLQKGDTVAMIAVGSYPVIAAFAGILQAGGVVLPVAPGTPQKRMEYMLENAGCRFVFYEGEQPTGIEKDYQYVDAANVNVFARASLQLEPVVTPTDLAYILYTSGSTGLPKAVMVSHQSIAHYITWAADTYLAGEPLNFALFTPLSFDLTMTAIFTPLVSGAAIVVFDEVMTRGNLLSIFEHPLVGAIKCTPSHLAVIARIAMNGGQLKKIIVGGEAFDTPLAGRIAKLFPQAAIYNEYGPTETTVGCMIHRFNPQLDTSVTVSIGQAITGARILVLDTYLMPVPEGSIGEICIGGPGLALGYLHDDMLTAQKFIDDPYTPGERLYLSGDLAKVHANDQLEYIGRKDEQIKLNGYRIEPGEIRNAMLEMEGIDDCNVVIYETTAGEKLLCAYYLSAKEFSKEDITTYLSQRLPAYMIPSFFPRVNEFPLTANGKLDKKKLPDPFEVNSADVFESMDDTEQWLLKAWKQVLAKEYIPVNKSFFDAGGSSLRVLELCGIIAERMEEPEEELIMLVFKYPSIRDFATYIRQKKELPKAEDVTAAERLNAGKDRFRKMRLKTDTEEPGNEDRESIMI